MTHDPVAASYADRALFLADGAQAAERAVRARAFTDTETPSGSGWAAPLRG